MPRVVTQDDTLVHHCDPETKKKKKKKKKMEALLFNPPKKLRQFLQPERSFGIVKALSW